MHVEVKLALEVMRSKLAEVGLVPDDDVGMPNFVEPCPAGEKGVDYGWYVFQVLKEELSLQGCYTFTDVQSSAGHVPLM